VLLAVGGAWGVSRLTAAPWAVTALAGRPAVGAVPVAGATRLTTGAALSTDAVSAARVNVGRIGRADVGPGSRLRLVRAAGTEHRLALERGTLHARIWAPPRFFLVETPSALAVDLGCVYALSVAADGSGLLRVESGQVELVAGARRALVPAGNAATLRPGRGPGLPFPTAGPPELRAAVAAYEAAEGGGGVGADAPLDALLDASGREATITLWHLLPRVGPGERGRVHARLAALAPPPAGVTADAVLRLDARALARWRDALEPSWTTETVPAWKRAWRRLWTAFVAAG
jgi:hypothetical protein